MIFLKVASLLVLIASIPELLALQTIGVILRWTNSLRPATGINRLTNVVLRHIRVYRSRRP